MTSRHHPPLTRTAHTMHTLPTPRTHALHPVSPNVPLPHPLCTHASMSPPARPHDAARLQCPRPHPSHTRAHRGRALVHSPCALFVPLLTAAIETPLAPVASLTCIR